MSNETSKTFSDRDFQQTLRASFNDVDKTLSVNGFLVGKVGNKITRSVTTTTVAGDSEVWSFYDQTTTLLYTFTIVYTDNTLSDMISATRTA